MTALNAAKLATLFVLTALVVAGCGRKGQLEVPRSQPAVEDADGNEEQEREDRRFVLDPLIL